MDHGHDMPGMAHMMPPTSSTPPMMMHHMMMHMTFFWGENQVLFSGWPGISSDIFLERDDDTNHVLAGFVQTLLHCIRVGLSYLVMLAVMCFNGGVFCVSVAGHSLGFLCFGSRVFMKSSYAKASRLP
ncbi:LOW QUALITY PROTEIN: Ctr domain-containing protein, partial [Cephalotus follicularis]